MKLSYLYSKFFKKIIRGKAVIHSDIDKTVVINSGCEISYSSIGKYSYCGYDCCITHCDIGKFCSLASRISIGAAEHPIDWVSTSPVFENTRHSGPKKRFSRKPIPAIKRTIIGHDVWIGNGVIIKQGVVIGNGAIIGAGAVVTKDVKPYSIVAGCPAKHLRDRFSIDIANKLEQSQWWHLSDDELYNVADDIDNPIKFIESIKNLKRL